MTAIFETNGQSGFISAFELKSNDLELTRLAQPTTPFDKVGRKFAILGYESGVFEAWAYPLKLFRNFGFKFYLGSSTTPINAADVVHRISVTPEATVITYTYQSFTVRSIYVTPIEEPGAIIFLEVHSIAPLTIVCEFLPVLQPMWPAGIGGQYAYWNEDLHAYLISEPTGQNHGLIGSPAGNKISDTPAHMLSDTPHEFKMEIAQPENVAGKYIPIYMAGGKGKRKKVIGIYQKLQNQPQQFYQRNVKHFRQLRENTLQVQTPNHRLNLAFEWAKVAYDNLMVDNPDLGKGLLAGLGPSGNSGRPGFGWFFGGDAYINMFSLNGYGVYQTVRDALAFTQQWQRDDGKMAHELSQAAAYLNWFEDYPYGYIHGDTTPFYIAAMYDYYKMSGDLDFVKQSWESLKRAYNWCLSTDVNQDGLMDNKEAGLAATEYGALTGIASDSYLSAVWTRAAYSMQFLAEALNDQKLTQKAARHFQKAKKAFNEKFWDEEIQYYVHAFNDRGEKVKEISPWNTVGLFWELGDPQKSRRSLRRLNSAELTTDWGVRNISNQSQYYKPLGYNYGAIWPFVTSWVTAAQYKHHFALPGYQNLMAAVGHTFNNALGYIDEVFSGDHHIWLEESVPHQGFSSAGVVLPLVRGLLGLEGNAITKEIVFAPQLPADWDQLSVENYQIGEASFSFEYERAKDNIIIRVKSVNAPDYTLQCAPALGNGTQVKKIQVDGKAVEFQQHQSGQVIQPVFSVDLNNATSMIEIDFIPTVELLPPQINSQIGDMNKGLKIISIEQNDNQLNVTVEGLANQTYALKLLNADKIDRVKDAVYENNAIQITIPDDEPQTFVRQVFSIIIKE